MTDSDPKSSANRPDDSTGDSPPGTNDSSYRVALEVYSGPMDLLLFLIKREEVDIYDIPISRITEQYIKYVELLKEIDPEVVSEFLVLAATLMEIKSRTLLPRPVIEEEDEEMMDPRSELVRQLLEYKKFKDAARDLESAAAEHARKHARAPVLPPHDPNDISLDTVDIWNLFEAFNKILTQIGKDSAVHKISVDDTPIRLHAADIIDSLERAGGEQKFEAIFVGRDRGEMIGLFLALLELIRRWRVKAIQERALGSIHLKLLDATPLGEEVEDAYQYEQAELIDERTAPVEDIDPSLLYEDDDGAEDPDDSDDGDVIAGVIDSTNASETAPKQTNTDPEQDYEPEQQT